MSLAVSLPSGAPSRRLSIVALLLVLLGGTGGANGQTPPPTPKPTEVEQRIETALYQLSQTDEKLKKLESAVEKIGVGLQDLHTSVNGLRQDLKQNAANGAGTQTVRPASTTVEALSQKDAETEFANTLNAVERNTTNFLPFIEEVKKKFDAVVNDINSQKKHANGQSVQTQIENDVGGVGESRLKGAAASAFDAGLGSLTKLVRSKAQGGTPTVDDWKVACLGAIAAINSRQNLPIAGGGATVPLAVTAGAAQPVAAGEDKGSVIGQDFWYRESDDRNKPKTYAGYHDGSFDENALKLATVFDELSTASVKDAAEMRSLFKKKMAEFLNGIDNRFYPSKRLTWANLVETWRGQLIIAKSSNKFDNSSVAAYQSEYKHAAEGLRKAAVAWDEARTLGLEKNSGEGGSLTSATLGGGRGGASTSSSSYGGYGGATIAAIWHERTMAHIDRTHERRIQRIERIKSHRP